MLALKKYMCKRHGWQCCGRSVTCSIISEKLSVTKETIPASLSKDNKPQKTR